MFRLHNNSRGHKRTQSARGKSRLYQADDVYEINHLIQHSVYSSSPRTTGLWMKMKRSVEPFQLSDKTWCKVRLHLDDQRPERYFGKWSFMSKAVKEHSFNIST